MISDFKFALRSLGKNRGFTFIAVVTLRSNQSVPELEDLQTQSESFESVGGVSAQPADYSGGGEPIQVELGLVASDFFRVLGARAVLGRTLIAADDRFGAEPLVVLSHGLWQRQFARDPAIL